MRNWLTLSLIAPFALACATDHELAYYDYDEDAIGYEQQEIVNGQTNNGDPALVFIWLGGGSCSGTMITKKVVVTARHCFVDQAGNQAALQNLSIYFGTQPQNGDASIAVADYRVHPNADLAVLTMAQPGAPTPIPMNQRAMEQYVGQQVRVAGYGVTAENNTDSGLKRVGVTAVAATENVQNFGSVFYVGQTGSKTCYGDSGGPAFMTFEGQEYIAGVTSFGTGPCENQGTLDGELRIDVYHDWLVQYINEKDPGGLTPPNTGNGQEPNVTDPPQTGSDSEIGSNSPSQPSTNPNPAPTAGGEASQGELQAPSLVGCQIGSEGDSSPSWLLLTFLACAILRRRKLV